MRNEGYDLIVKVLGTIVNDAVHFNVKVVVCGFLERGITKWSHKTVIGVPVGEPLE